jgi:hypothetical protein
MEKYGVALDEEKTKTASASSGPGTCPRCQQKLDDSGLCPTHGTEPFEKRKEQEDGST